MEEGFDDYFPCNKRKIKYKLEHVQQCMNCL